MGGLLTFLVMVGFCGLILGLISPRLVLWGSGRKSRGRVILIYGLGPMVLAMVSSTVLPRDSRQQGQTAYVTTKVLNLRSAPNLESKIVEKLALGAELAIRDTVGDWLHTEVENGEKTGWVHQRYVGGADELDRVRATIAKEAKAAENAPRKAATSKSQSTPERGANAVVAARTADPKPSLSAEQSAEIERLRKERSSYNRKRGTNQEAARTAELLVKMYKKAGVRSGLDLHLDLQGDNEKGFAEGTVSLEVYRANVWHCYLTMVVDTSLWGAMAADQRKDLVHTLVQFLKKQYPGCAPNVEVFNSSKRSVAKGKWSIWSGVPTVALK